MNKRPNILITNDDGINALGIKHLWNSLKNFADLTIIAPHMEQSAVGLSISIRQPLHIQAVTWANPTKAWSVTGTPADCVKLALKVILDSPPDLVVSGINRGTNAGRNVLYSGTVAGAIEGVMHNIPGVAFSCNDFIDPDYQLVEKYIPTVIKHVLEHPLPSGTLLNVNFPEKVHGIKGFKMARQGKEHWSENPDKRTHPVEGHDYYWLGNTIATFDEDTESDIAWLKQGYVTAVPIHIGELTDHAHLKKSKSHFEGLWPAGGPSGNF